MKPHFRGLRFLVLYILVQYIHRCYKLSAYIILIVECCLCPVFWEQIYKKFFYLLNFLYIIETSFTLMLLLWAQYICMLWLLYKRIKCCGIFFVCNLANSVVWLLSWAWIVATSLFSTGLSWLTFGFKFCCTKAFIFSWLTKCCLMLFFN